MTAPHVHNVAYQACKAFTLGDGVYQAGDTIPKVAIDELPAGRLRALENQRYLAPLSEAEVAAMLDSIELQISELEIKQAKERP